MKIIFILVLNTLFYLCLSVENPGLILKIADKGIKTIQDFILPNLIDKQIIELPNITLKQHVDFLGTIKLNVTESKFVFQLGDKDQIKLNFVEPSNIDLQISKLNGTIDFNYKFLSNFYENIGKGYVNITKIKLNLNARLFSQPNLINSYDLSPGIEITKLTIDSAEMDIYFDNMGNLEKLVKYFVDSLQQTFLNLLRQKLEDSIASINQFTKYSLSAMSLESDINSNLTIRYPLFNSPKVIKNSLEIYFNASIYSKANNITYSGASQPLPQVLDSTKGDFIAYVNQYIFDSLFYTLYRQNKTNAYLDSKDISILSTATFGLAIPQLITKYGLKPMDINLQSIKFPVFNLNENLTLIELVYNSSFIVKVDDKSKETAFNADINLAINTTLVMNKGRLAAKVYGLKIDKFKVTSSNIGEIDDKNLPEMLNGIVSGFLGVIQSAIDKFLDGIIIPAEYDPLFNNTDIMSHKGYMEVDITPVFQDKKIAGLVYFYQQKYNQFKTIFNLKRENDNMKFLE